MNFERTASTPIAFVFWRIAKLCSCLFACKRFGVVPILNIKKRGYVPDNYIPLKHLKNWMHSKHVVIVLLCKTDTYDQVYLKSQ